MTIDLKRALLFAKVSAIAYDDPSDKADAELLALGLVKLAHFDHETSHAVLAHDGDGRLILAHRGTMFSQADIRNILVNLDLRKVSHFLGGKVPIGYYDAACRVWAQAYSFARARRLNRSRLVVTGHSMGGVDATLSGSIAYALGIYPEVWTYGAPKPGDADFCAAIGGMNLTRIVRERDFAPTHSLVGDFAQPGEAQWLHAGTVTAVRERPGVNERIEDHWIEKYIADLEALVDAAMVAA